MLRASKECSCDIFVSSAAPVNHNYREALPFSVCFFVFGAFVWFRDAFSMSGWRFFEFLLFFFHVFHFSGSIPWQCFMILLILFLNGVENQFEITKPRQKLKQMSGRISGTAFAFGILKINAPKILKKSGRLLYFYVKNMFVS